MYRSAILLLIISSFLVSCSHKDDPVGPDTTDDVIQTPHGDTTFYAHIQIATGRYRTPKTTTIDTALFGQFQIWSPTLRPIYVYPKAFTYNGLRADFVDSVTRSLGLRSGTHIPLVYGGGMLRFVVEGNRSFPRIVDSLQAPSGTVELIEPRLTDTISWSKGVMVRWRRTGSDRVLVNLLTSGSDHLLKSFPPGVDSLFVAPSQLPPGPGPFQVYVTTSSVLNRKRTDGVQYIFSMESDDGIILPMTP
jgi:hypothetical protein